MEAIKKKLEQARQSLLDLTRRNRLINFRPGKRNSLRIVDEIPAEVYRTLVTDGKNMEFLPLEKSEHYRRDELSDREPDGEELTLFELPEEDDGGKVAGRHTDRYLQTALSGERLQTQLIHLSREAESALQERGCGILFLAIGLLEWTERADSQVRSRAPVVLVPVELVRETAKKRFKIRRFDDEPTLNPSLEQLCRQKFGFEFPAFDQDAPDPINRLFTDIEEKIAEQDGWLLIPEMHAGLFSFAKILMYLDLDDKRWPEAKAISKHKVLGTLMGFGNDTCAHTDVLRPDEIDDKVPPHETFQVVDADSSQQAAILAAKRGLSMVIEGPPGTGKSQTITNIIAECLSEGKKVLFVAEKSAALDVVKRRLVLVGLGDFVTELHSRKASKKVFMDELRRSMASEHAVPDQLEFDADRLTQLRARLNAYVRTLHKSVPPLKLSPYVAIGKCAELRLAPEAPFGLSDVTSWDRKKLAEAKETVSRSGRAAERVGDTSTHPWRGVGEHNLSLQIRQQLPQILAALEASIQHSVTAGEKLAKLTVATPPMGRGDCIALLTDAKLISDGTWITPDRIVNPVWNTVPPGVQDLLVAGEKLGDMRAKLGDRWADTAEDIDWSAVAARRRSWSHSWLRWLNPFCWRDAWLIRQHLSPGKRIEKKTIGDDFVIQSDVRNVKFGILREEERWAELFGPLWNGSQSEWLQLKAFARTLLRIRQQVLKNPAAERELCEILAEEKKRRAVRDAAGALQLALKKVKEHWRQLRDALKVDGGQFLDEDPNRASFRKWLQRIREAAHSRDSLVDWAEFLRAREACHSRGLDSFLSWTTDDRTRHGPLTWGVAFERQFFRLWLDTLTRENSVLREFRGNDHATIVKEFREVDRRWLELSRTRLASQIAERRPRVGQSFGKKSGLAILEAELRRKKRSKSIRQLLASPAGEAIQDITPCFMMSPISVAQFLEPGVLEFDVVIFDEASQVEWADALGSIARGPQLILVGDEKQLPPTNFFNTVDNTSDEDEEDELAIQDLESVLAVGHTTLSVRTTLRWHYRSRHDSLISFSNMEFYDNLLRVFPSPCLDREELGLSFRHVAGGIYHRGKGQFNRVEAQIVAKAVIEHARTKPNLSLGVGAFSKAQQNAIEDQIESLRRTSTEPVVEQFFTKQKDESFFVKNLETIQGDERDVIYLSVGYGRDEAGRFTMNFGPVNKDGGWRRLNVLITRARLRCVVFSSIVSDDIRVEPGSPRGVIALKRYLKYAEEGTLPVDIVPRGDFDSPFEKSVYDALQEADWDVHSQVGCAGFAIDLAVIDPKLPGRYLCGIECDGATYHSSATARDRDRLRQAVLEDLGWKIIRIWSTDWYHQPDITLTRLLDQVARLTSEPAVHATADGRGPRSVAVGGNPSSGYKAEETRVTQERASSNTRQAAAGPPKGIVPYKRFGGRSRGDRNRLLRLYRAELAEFLKDIVNVEGPIHLDELFRVAAGHYKARATGAAREALIKALNEALLDDLRRHGPFIWPRSMEHPPIRWRDTVDAVSAAELICPEEVAEAAAWVVEHEYGIPRDDLPAAAMRAMGFKRIGTQLSELAEQGVRLAIDSKRVVMNTRGILITQSSRDQ